MVAKPAHILKNGFDVGDFPDVLVVPASARLAAVVCHCGALFYVPESYRSWKQQNYEALNCPEGALSVNPGVGCAAAILKGWVTRSEPDCCC